MKRSILLIDISSIWYQCWHATGDSEVGAAFNRTLAKVAQLSEGYELVAICCDSPPYDRKKILPTYKAQRDKPSEVMVEQFRRVIERSRADGFPVWSHPGAEADDVIATACARARHDGLTVVIASSDKDVLQLVDTGHVSVISPATGETFANEDAVYQKFGVYPHQVANLLALMGDSADNVPGVAGVGVKTAARLLYEYADLEGVLDRGAYAIPPSKVRDALIADADKARLAKRLIALRDDVPIDFKQIYEERKPEPLTVDALVDEKSESDSTEAAKPKDALVLVPQTLEWSLQLEPSDSTQAWKLTKILYNSRAYQKFGTPEAILAVVLRGRALGLDATLSLEVFHLIEGKLTMHADLIEALVHRSGAAEYFGIVETTDERATYKTKRKGQFNEEVRISFSIENALIARLVTKATAGLNGYAGVSSSGKATNWDKYRATMLRHRAKTQLARAVYPDIVLGLYTPDEIVTGELIERET